MAAMKLPSAAWSRRDFLAAGTGLGVAAVSGAEVPATPPTQATQVRLFGLRHPPLERVRVGFIGVGNRGLSLMGNLLDLDGVDIKAVCDVVPDRVRGAQRRVVDRGHPEPAAYQQGPDDYQGLCRRADIDLVYIATPWDSHVPMAVETMKQGKHVAVEVPAALTIEECWNLVDTAERTRRHCLMLENCCYGEIELLVLRMARAGILGELTHAEAGYLHEARDYLLQDTIGSNWRRRFVTALDGNLYPTHGLGPVAMYLGIHAGDRFERLVSMSSPEAALSERRDALPPDHPRRSDRYACGDINTSMLKTARGRTVLVQFSMVMSRPYSRINLLAGTRGTFCDYPPRLHLDGHGEDWITDLQPFHDRHGHPFWKRLNQQARQSGGHGGMDYIMNWRLVQCLHDGLPLDMTVYDAAAWSSILPLSVASVSAGGAPVAVPDFTRGAWKDQPDSALAVSGPTAPPVP